MKKLIVILLLLCLLLAGCEIEAQDETIAPEPLPFPTNGQVETGAAVTAEPGAEALPVLETRNFADPMVQGPAGNVYAVYYRNVFGDPVYGDVDGDGQIELVYNSYGASEGKVYDAIVVYGLENGWPVQKGNAFFCIGSARCKLTVEDGQVYYSYQNKALGYEEPVLLPLRVENWVVHLNDDEMPEGMEDMKSGVMIVGLSWRELKQRVGDRALASEKNYLIWREPGVLYTEEELGGEQATFVAATKDGAAVSQRVGWWTLADGTREASSNACKVDRAATVMGKTESELIHLYGEPAFELLRSNDGFAALCWFTSSGKLMTVQFDGKAVSATFTDLPME